jgi:putative transposase
MPRHARSAPGGFVYHALNRATARLLLLRKPGDYDAFLRLLEEALAEHPTRLLAFCLRPTHWHLVVWPERDGALTAFVRWLTLTHAVRRHTHYRSLGSGHLYQGRFKAFPVSSDEHFYTVLRSVERNPLRAHWLSRAEAWRWSSLSLAPADAARAGGLLQGWPVARPDDGVAWVNAPQTEAELAAVRRAVARGSPYGPPSWSEAVIGPLGLEHTLRPRGRPKKKPTQASTIDS